MKKTCLLTLSYVTAVALSVPSGNASAHAVLNQMESPANYFYTAELRITHGCGISPSHTIKVLLPEGVERVTPRYKHGWEVSTKMKKREMPRMIHDLKITEEVSEVTWSGGSLPYNQYDEFHIRMWLTGEPGEVKWFKTVQHCDNGESERWIEIPAEGVNPFTLEAPAPFVKLTKPSENAPY